MRPAATHASVSASVAPSLRQNAVRYCMPPPHGSVQEDHSDAAKVKVCWMGAGDAETLPEEDDEAVDDGTAVEDSVGVSVVDVVLDAEKETDTVLVVVLL